MNFVGLQCFREGERGQYGRQSLGQHGLACTGWANENDIVSTSSGNLHTAFHGLLPFHIGKIQKRVLLVL